MKVKQLNNIWIPEEELKLWESTFKEIEEESFAIAMGWKKPEPVDLTQKFFFVNLSCAPGLGMERQSDKQIFEMDMNYQADLTKPVDRKYFERYSRGMDL